MSLSNQGRQRLYSFLISGKKLWLMEDKEAFITSVNTITVYDVVLVVGRIPSPCAKTSLKVSDVS